MPEKELELAGETGFIGDAWIPVTFISFLGVARGGASHISTSLELSESPSEMTSSDLRWFCWIEISCGMLPAGTALLTEDLPSPRSSCVGSVSTAFLDLSTPVDCPGLPEKEVVGISVSLDCSRGDSTVDCFLSGCSGKGVVAFLFPRSWLVSEGLLNIESNMFCSLFLDVPLKIAYKQSKTGQRKR